MKRFLFILSSLAVVFGISFYLYNNRVNNVPKVFAGVIIEEYDGMVPLLLRSIGDWDYDKSKIAMEMHLVTGGIDIRTSVDEWIKQNRSAYDSLELIDERPLVSKNASRIDINRILGRIKDGLLAKSKEEKCDYCFITSSDTVLRPYTLSYLVEKKKPIIAPMLYSVPQPGDQFRNFFAAVTDNGYYKDDPQYRPIANREMTGTFALPCVHIAYLIDTSHIDKLSFSKDFTDWEFLAFAKSARKGNIEQYLTNEREFGVFLHLEDRMTKGEKTSYSILNNANKLTPEFILNSVKPYLAETPSVKAAASELGNRRLSVINLREGSSIAVDDVHDAIDRYIVKYGYGSDDHIVNQYKKYAKEGSEVVIAGTNSSTHPIELSKLVGTSGTVYVWEPLEKSFCMQAINKELNGCKNINLKNISDSSNRKTKDRSKTHRLDDLSLTNLSFVEIGSESDAISLIRSGLEVINKFKPVLMVTIEDDAKEKIGEIRSLGYTYTPIADNIYLFIPLKKANLVEDKTSEEVVLPPVAALIDKLSQPSNADVKSPFPPIKVTWEGTFLDFTSLSHVNRAITEAIIKSPSIELSSVGPNFSDINLTKFEELQQMAKRMKPSSPADTEITVRHKWPPKWEKPATGKWVLMQPWEFGSLPEEWVKGVANVDEVWVYTQYVKQVYIDSGISPDKVHIIPCGINPAIFKEDVTPYPIPTKKKFKFLFLGGTIYRKGADILLNSYLQAFDSSDDVCLVFKDFGTKGAYANHTTGEQILRAKNTPGAPEIFYIDDDMDVDQIASMYAACDCLVYPYRGEGFAMPVLEAMACGVPVMVTDGGATDDFVSPSFGWKIPSKRAPLGKTVTSFKLHGEGWFLETDGEILSGMMRWVSEHPEQAQQKGAAAAKFAKEYMTWDRVSQAAVDRLEAIRQKSP